MSRFITSGFQSAIRSIISFSSRQIHCLMAAAGSNSETDSRGDLEKEDGDDLHRPPDAESDAELSNGSSVVVSLSKTSDDDIDVLDTGSSSQKRQFSACSGVKMSPLAQEKDCSLRRMLFARDQPKRQFHFSFWNSSEKDYTTSEQVIKDEKGKQTSFDFSSYFFYKTVLKYR